LIATSWTIEITGVIITEMERGLLSEVYDNATYRMIANFERADFEEDDGYFVTMGNHPTGDILLGVVGIDGVLTCREMHSLSPYSHVLLQAELPAWNIKSAPAVHLPDGRGPDHWDQHPMCHVTHVAGFGKRIVVPIKPCNELYMLRVVYTDAVGSRSLHTPTIPALAPTFEIVVPDRPECRITCRDLNTDAIVTCSDPKRVDTPSSLRFSVLVAPEHKSRDFEVTTKYGRRRYTTFFTLLSGKSVVTVTFPKG
jgi:hypothetical protein